MHSVDRTSTIKATSTADKTDKDDVTLHALPEDDKDDNDVVVRD